MHDFDEFFALKVPGLEVSFVPSEEELRDLKISAPRESSRTSLSLEKFLSLNRQEREKYLLKNRVNIKPNLDVDHPDELLYYQSAGGGTHARLMFPFLSIQPWVRSWIEVRRTILPPEFLSVHLRSTDWMRRHVPKAQHMMAYEAFLGNVSNVSMGRPVFLATDNPSLLPLAQAVLNQSKVICLPPSFSLDRDQARHFSNHYKDSSARREATLLSLFDLYALSGSSHFVFPSYVNRATGDVRASGFSILAEGLFNDSPAFDSFFGLSRPGVLSQQHPNAQTFVLKDVTWKARIGKLKGLSWLRRIVRSIRRRLL